MVLGIMGKVSPKTRGGPMEVHPSRFWKNLERLVRWTGERWGIKQGTMEVCVGGRGNCLWKGSFPKWYNICKITEERENMLFHRNVKWLSMAEIGCKGWVRWGLRVWGSKTMRALLGKLFDGTEEFQESMNLIWFPLSLSYGGLWLDVSRKGVGHFS